MDTSIIYFPEFREKPKQLIHTANKFQSPSGRELSSVLYNLKVGDMPNRSKFREIQTYFSKTFPNLKLDTKEGPEIVLEKTDNYEVCQDSISGGLYEIINLITHLVASKNHIFMIDEPVGTFTSTSSAISI